jgi:uncharacterized membrane protein YgdD (TMEM256/DUF423 family)
VKSPRLLLALGAALVAVGVALEAWHAHGLRSSLAPEAWEAVGRAVRTQETAGLGLFLTGLAVPRGRLLLGAAFLVSALLFCGSVYLKHLAGLEGATAVAPLGGSLQILSWLGLALLARPRGEGDWSRHPDSNWG